jgi:putative flavoprotein involved in K+ transport
VRTTVPVPAIVRLRLAFPARTIDGASTEVPDLYFCGVHFLRTRRSSLLFGVGADAAVVAHQIAAHHR